MPFDHIEEPKTAPASPSTGASVQAGQSAREAQANFSYEPLTPPSSALLPRELMVLGEGAALVAAWPFLDNTPKGDNHSVLVIPGFSATDTSMLPMRSFLARRGFDAHGWEQGRNLGATEAVMVKLADRLEQLADTSGRKVSLVGWSLGGCMAREIARAAPELVRGVITLGSPFRDVRANNIALLWRYLAAEDAIEDEALERSLGMPLPVPSTAIYTSSDAIVAGEACRELPGGQRESIEVIASHLGLAYNPLVYVALADRLAQKDGEWAGFVPPDLLEAFYGTDFDHQ